MPELFNYSYRLLNLNQAGTLVDFEFPIEGQKLIYMSPTDGPQLSIKLQSKSNDGIPFRPQAQIVAPFHRLYISGVIGATFPILIVASPASLSIESRDVNVNSIATLSTITNPVIVKPFDLDRAQNLQIFERGAVAVSGGGLIGVGQILNPAASGKTVVVRTSAFTFSSAPAWEIRQSNTALATLLGTLFNVNSGGANSVAQMRTELLAALPGSNVLQRGAMGAAVRENLERFDILEPGEGLIVGPTTINLIMDFSFRIWEF